MKRLKDIRSSFIEYFEKNDHTVLPSSPLIPRHDPTLMFTNSGMVPFKNIFTGQEKPDYPRVVTVQKCIRAGGKHNDLENVGYTARHHTFFEMLGNFSFGDYFKERAIALAWNLITREFSLPAHRLLVTVHHSDDEAFELWKKIAGLPENRIIRIASSDNFWSMGDLGPCGPCSEIFYDHGESLVGGIPGTPEQDGDRYVEIWNLVFMQFEQLAKEHRLPLPHPSIDTGMGLERIAAVLQGCHDNYDIDVFRTLIQACEDKTHVRSKGGARISHRVIADHLRALGFLIAEGVLPSNEGRGYLLRRIIRRAMRHAHLLGVKEPMIYRLVPDLVQTMGDAWPELVAAESSIGETVYQEEVRFLDTLARGLKILSDCVAPLSSGSVLDGEVAFKLYDTYGFPLDLTEDILKQQNMSVDRNGFDVAMQNQKKRARENWVGSGEKECETVWFSMLNKYGATEFLGYDTKNSTETIQALVRDGQEISEAHSGQEIAIIVKKTPFYAESGGQLADTGVMSSNDFTLEISDVRKKSKGLIVHFGKVLSGVANTGSLVSLLVSQDRRRGLSAHHSATHLIHAALRSVLGAHVFQKGSRVEPDRLRFDFSHSKPLDRYEIEKIEAMVNAIILANYTVCTRVMNVKDAMEQGALALFGEKYSDEVRVVSIKNDSDSSTSSLFSMELCGGTHVSRTAEIGLIRIISESPVGAGVRRLEALTGEAARIYLNRQEDFLKSAAALLKVSPSQVASHISLLLEEKKNLEHDLKNLRKQIAYGESGQNSFENEKIGDIPVFTKVLRGASFQELRSCVDAGKKSLGSGIIIIFSEIDNKAHLVVGVTSDLTSFFNAQDCVRGVAHALGLNSGGGRSDMAQMGGLEKSLIPDVIKAIKEMIKNKA